MEKEKDHSVGLLNQYAQPVRANLDQRFSRKP